MYEELIKSLRICGDWTGQVRLVGRDCCDGCKYQKDGVCESFKGNKELLLIEAADAIEELQDKVDRAICFWDSKEIAEAMRELNSYLPNITDPAWQKAHREMGFISPLADIYEELGVYDEPPKEETE